MPRERSRATSATSDAGIRRYRLVRGKSPRRDACTDVRLQGRCGQGIYPTFCIPSRFAGSERKAWIFWRASYIFIGQTVQGHGHFGDAALFWRDALDFTTQAGYIRLVEGRTCGFWRAQIGGAT